VIFGVKVVVREAGVLEVIWKAIVHISLQAACMVKHDHVWSMLKIDVESGKCVPQALVRIPVVAKHTAVFQAARHKNARWPRTAGVEILAAPSPAGSCLLGILEATLVVGAPQGREGAVGITVFLPW
jgi:hypothetical protein